MAKNGAILATNLPIQAFPSYEHPLEDENDPSKTNNVVVDEGANFVEAMGNNGRAKHPAGLRLYNQKYYPVRYDENDQLLYLKKVPIYRPRNTGAPASPQPKTTLSSALSTSRTKWRTESPRTPESLTSGSRGWPTTSRSKDTDDPFELYHQSHHAFKHYQFGLPNIFRYFVLSLCTIVFGRFYFSLDSERATSLDGPWGWSRLRCNRSNLIKLNKSRDFWSSPLSEGEVSNKFYLSCFVCIIYLRWFR